jgi:FixJ family two-component response regulator
VDDHAVNGIGTRRAPPLVLVVDPDRTTREILNRLVRAAGVEVRAMPGPAPLFAPPRPDRPACLVLAVELAEGDGLTVQERLCAAGADLPTVFVSARADVTTSVRAMKQGAVDFIEKPLDRQRIEEAVHAALDRATALRQGRAERARAAALVAALTPREREVLKLLTAGLRNKASAQRLGVAEKTVKAHRSQVMRKMGTDSVARLVVLAQQAGVISGVSCSGSLLDCPRDGGGATGMRRSWDLARGYS